MCQNPQPHDAEDCVPALFLVGEKVHYPHHGVAVVERVGPSPIMPSDDPNKYYHLRLTANNGKILVPIQNAPRLGMRRLCKKWEIKALCAFLEKKAGPFPREWQIRYRENLRRMETGHLEEIAVVLKVLEKVRKCFGLSFREMRMHDRAKNAIVSEIAAVMRMTKTEAETLVEKLLEKALRKSA